MFKAMQSLVKNLPQPIGRCRSGRKPTQCSKNHAASLGQVSSRFFEKKRRKKLLSLWIRACRAPVAQIKKVFLLLFLQKKKFFLPSRHPGPCVVSDPGAAAPRGPDQAPSQ